MEEPACRLRTRSLCTCVASVDGDQPIANRRLFQAKKQTLLISAQTADEITLKKKIDIQ